MCDRTTARRIRSKAKADYRSNDKTIIYLSSLRVKKLSLLERPAEKEKNEDQTHIHHFKYMANLRSTILMLEDVIAS